MIFANQTTMCFICTCNAQEGESREGKPHLMRQTETHPRFHVNILTFAIKVNKHFEAAEFTRFVHRQKFDLFRRA